MKKIIFKIIILLPLLLAAVPSVYSQKSEGKFSIASFELSPLDLDASAGSATSIEDGNGDLFAIIKVTSNNPDDDLSSYNFNFGDMQDIEKPKDGELWVYVQRNAKHVTITRNGYRPIKNYEFGFTIQPGRVYSMSLSVTAPTVYRQMLQFNVEPAGVKATVFVRGINDNDMQRLGDIDEATGSFAKSLELGTYTYEIYSDNYHKSEGRIVLKERNGHHIEEVTLRPKFSNITLNAGSGIDIYINDERVGHDTWTGILNAGTYNIECRKPNHKSVVDVITVKENDDQTIYLSQPTPIIGVLAVTSTPLGANIKIDGKDYGVTPKNIDGLLIGTHTVELSKANYKSETATVEILENQTAECHVALNDIATMTISSRPQNAQLYINGEHVGETPYTADMPSGDYKIAIKKKKYHDFERHVHLDSSDPNVSFSLKRQYQQKFSGYLQASGQFGSYSGVGLNLGCYLHNFNLEAYGIYGSGSEELYENFVFPIKFSSYSFGGKVGYGIILGTRFRLTPQAGIGVLLINGESSRIGNIETSPLVGTAALKCECALVNNFGVSLAPEYSFVLSEKEGYEKISNVSSKIKGWGTGFNVRLGLYLYF